MKSEDWDGKNNGQRYEHKYTGYLAWKKVDLRSTTAVSFPWYRDHTHRLRCPLATAVASNLRYQKLDDLMK